MQFVSFTHKTYKTMAARVVFFFSLQFINNDVFVGSFCHCYVCIFWICVLSFLPFCSVFVKLVISLYDFIRSNNIDFFFWINSTCVRLLFFLERFFFFEGKHFVIRYNLIVCGADKMQSKWSWVESWCMDHIANRNHWLRFRRI